MEKEGANALEMEEEAHETREEKEKDASRQALILLAFLYPSISN